MLRLISYSLTFKFLNTRGPLQLYFLLPFHFNLDWSLSFKESYSSGLFLQPVENHSEWFQRIFFEMRFTLQLAWEVAFSLIVNFSLPIGGLPLALELQVKGLWNLDPWILYGISVYDRVVFVVFFVTIPKCYAIKLQKIKELKYLNDKW